MIMKTMKLWRNILVMTAAMLSFASCSSDDDEDFFTIGTDGIPMPATYHSVSQADFQKFIVGTFNFVFLSWMPSR